MAYEETVNALAQTWSSLDSLLTGREEADFARPTACPGWSVRDVVSHLAGFELMLQGQPVAPYAGEYPAYVHNPIGEVNEAAVARWRDLPGDEVLAIFRRATAATLERLAALTRAEWERVGWSPEGERPYHRFMETRVLDSWIHLGDVRDALGLEGDDHGPGEVVVLTRFVEALPYVLAKRAAAPEGTTVAVELTGARPSRAVVAVRDGRGGLLDPTAPAPTTLTTSSGLFWRRAAGRIEAHTLLDDPLTRVEGDDALVARVVERLVVMI